MTSAAYDNIVASIFDAVLDERLTPAALKAVAAYVGASGATYLLVNKLTGQVSAAAWWGSFTSSRSDYLAHYGNIDRYRVILEEQECGSLMWISDCLSQTVLRHDEWYNDFIRKGGVCDVLGSKLYESQSHRVLLGLHRAIGDNNRRAGDKEAARTLLGPLRNAARLHVGLIDTGYRSAITRGRLNHIAAGVIFTRGDGRIVEINQEGSASCASGTG